MANINKNIRFYQPNDPYYYQVDNLPLVDLLNNDIALENRLTELEQSVNTVVTGGTQGSITLGSISDLKAYVEPVTGDIDKFGRIYVRPGKFNCRMQLPATRESGWRMMRDADNFFNNTNFNGTGGLASTSTEDDFVRRTKGLARTAIVEFYPDSSGFDKFIEIPSFDADEFNSSSPPAERLDLIYIKGSKALDTRYESGSVSIPEASIGTKIDVDTIDGQIEKLKIPEGTQNGDILRIRGKGMPGLHGRSQGDLYVEIHIKTPKKLSRKARKLLEELKDELKQ